MAENGYVLVYLQRFWWVAPLLGANILSFALMGIDKARAVRRAYRISERTLLLASACFGSIGGMAGMLAFRHKTQHIKFAAGLPLLLTAHILLIALFLQI